MAAFEAFLIVLLLPIALFSWGYFALIIRGLILQYKADAEADRMFAESVDRKAEEMQHQLQIMQMKKYLDELIKD